MPYSLDDKLVVGITSRALFDLDEADAVFRNEGLLAYRTFQREHEDENLEPGTGFPLVRGLLAINHRVDDRVVEVIVISRNDADSGMRFWNSIEYHGLDISRGAFTSGRDASRYLRPFCCDLFLSANPEDVSAAIGQGYPAALVCTPPEGLHQGDLNEVRIAFDGDAVLFDGESERVFQENGLEAFLEREARLADVPMNPGPFEPFLRGLRLVQDRFPEGASPIRTSLVTARNAPAHKRVVNTLRSWGVSLDESFFLGGIDKAPILAQLRPHIFFDDQMTHLEGSRRQTPSAQVLAALAGQPVGPQPAESAALPEAPARSEDDDGAVRSGA